MPNNTIVAIDLSFRNAGALTARPAHTKVGYELLDCANIKTAKASKKKNLFVAQDDVLESQKLYAGLLAYIQNADPTLCVAEMPTAGAKGARANRCMGMATGVAAALVVVTGLPFVWVIPEDSKNIFCGKKNASKPEMMAKAQELWPEFTWPKTKGDFEHVADAAAALLVARDNEIYKFMRGRTE